jgi:UDP-2,3-diacylglucosamine pyrophosphatase LpxH
MKNRRSLFLSILLSLWFAGSSWGAADATCQRLTSPVPPAGPRTAIFVSDLHLGVGRNPDDPARWHPVEDFRWAREFADFLDRVNQEEQGKVDLVLVGDVLELWQSLCDTDCHHEALDKNLGCAEAEAWARALRVVEQHQDVLDKLRWFATQGDNRVTIVPGNHDAALLFPSVARLLLDRIHAPAERLRIATEGYWWSADGKVLAEHGQQIGNDPNRFDGWPEHPFLERDGVRYLQQPWGEQMVQEIFNARERTSPTLDNLSEESLGFRLALASQPLGGKLASLRDLVRFLLFQTSWKQSTQGLGKKDSAHFDLDAIRDAYKGAPQQFVLDFLPPDDPLRGALQEELRAGGPGVNINDLENEEILSLCAQRAVYNEGLPPTVKPLPECLKTGGLGAVVQGLNDLLPGAKNKRLSGFLTCLKDGLPLGQRPTRQFTTYVYAHTHKERPGESPFSTKELWAPQIWNDGAWQRRMTPKQLCTIAFQKGYKGPKKEAEALLKIVPEDLPACYPYVRARWQAGKPDPEVALLYWYQETGKTGEGGLPTCPFKIQPDCEEKKKCLLRGICGWQLAGVECNSL